MGGWKGERCHGKQELQSQPGNTYSTYLFHVLRKFRAEVGVRIQLR